MWQNRAGLHRQVRNPLFIIAVPLLTLLMVEFANDLLNVISEEVVEEIEQRSLYTYESLPPGHIRLLQVISLRRSRIRCELRAFEINTEEKWHALSYVWGDETPECEIFLNKRRHLIRPNLLAALKAIHRNKGFMWIWMDAICIDQDNPAEKSEHIPRMDEIFSQAECVYLWFGDTKPDVQVAVKVLQWLHCNESYEEDRLAESREMQINAKFDEFNTDRLEKTAHELNTIHGLSHQQMLALKSLIDALFDMSRRYLERPVAREAVRDLVNTAPWKNDLLPPDDPFWTSLLDFLDGRWWRRIWTYQENLLAQQAGLLCTDGIVDYYFLSRCRETIFSSSAWSTVWSQEATWKLQERGHDVGQFMAAMRNDSTPIKTHLPKTFANLLLQIGDRQATIAKDCVFGLLGLLDRETRRKIRVDYTRSDAEVFAEAVKLAFSVEDYARLIPRLWDRYEMTESLIEGLPSWCPDFSNAFNCPPVPHPETLQWVGHEVREKYMHLARIDCERNDTTLGVRGVQLDCIHTCVNKTVRYTWACGWKVQNAAKVDEDLDLLFQIVFAEQGLEWLDSIQAAFTTEDDDSLASVLIQFKSILPWASQAGHATTSKFLHVLRTLGSIVRNHGLEAPEVVFEEFGITLDNLLITCTTTFNFLLDLNGKYIFKTRSGRFGCSFKPTHEGDRLLFVPGGTRLYLASASGESYVCTAYVDGLMEDSLLRDMRLESEQSKWEMFYLS